MNIVILGAGAIGSLFGSLLSKNNNVVMVGRKDHVDTINKKGLEIQGKTKIKYKIQAFEQLKDISFKPDLLIISVKSYDTEKAIKQAKSIINQNTIVMSIQNGLDNIEKISKFVNPENILICITTHGAFFSKPGVIIHTGIGKTTIGACGGKNIQKIQKCVKIFNNSDIKTSINTNIKQDMWIKAIINSSINPLTTFFQCKNGYLLENPILKNLVEQICLESTKIARKNGFSIETSDTLKKTKEVINDTADNYSSMLQSLQKGKKTEIDSINGKLVEIGKKLDCNTFLNEILIHSIKMIS